MRCVGYCPQKAVDCNTFLVLAFIFMFSAIPIELLIVNALNKLFAFSHLPGNLILLYIFYYIVVLLLCAAIYVVFYLLNRIPLIGKAFTYLSFTHYWRKYKQADVKIGALSEKHRWDYQVISEWSKLSIRELFRGTLSVKRLLGSELLYLYIINLYIFNAKLIGKKVGQFKTTYAIIFLS